MPNPNSSTQDWFYHAPAAKAEGPSCTVAPAPSQIPGLSNIPDNSVVEQDERCFRRKWVRDTDSKYVKLAKAGGRKHLLTFDNASKLSLEPVLYPRVDWFDHVHSEEVEQQENEQNLTKNCAILPEWYVHERPSDNSDQTCEGHEDGVKNIAVGRPMLGFDSMSIWQRENQLSTQKSITAKPVQLPKVRRKKPPMTTKTKFTKEQVKLPKIKSDISTSDVTADIKKLLSMDYQKEWLLNKSLENLKEAESRRKIQKEKHEREKRITGRNRRSLKSKEEITEEKPLFKLSRFNKVKSCVDTRWSKLETAKKSVAH